MSLLDTYNSMLAQSQAQQVEEVEKTAAATEVDERIAVLEKYAALADDLLEQEHGSEYTEDDVVKLAQLMINHDIQVQEEQEKVAELHDAGIIMAKAFKEELARQ